MASVLSLVLGGSILKSALFFFAWSPKMETWPKMECCLPKHNKPRFGKRACPSLLWALWAFCQPLLLRLMMALRMTHPLRCSALLFTYEATTNIPVMVLLNRLAARYRFREYGWPKSNALAVYHDHQNDIMFQQFHRYVSVFLQHQNLTPVQLWKDRF